MFEFLGVNSNWQVYCLGDFLEINGDSWIDIDDNVEYRILGVTSKGAGLVVKRTVSGAELKMRQYQVARLNQLMWCKVDTTNGALGITKSNHVGALSSPNMCLADINTERCLPDFLQLFFRLPIVYEGITAASLGTTNRQYIKPQELLKQVRLYLPPLNEQRRILARVEALASRITKAQSLREELNEETELLFAAELKRLRYELLDSEFTKSKLGNITQVTSGGTPSRDNPSYWNGKIPWIRTGELLDGNINSSGEHITEEGIKNSSAKLFPKETILIALYGQGQTRGRTGRLMIEATTNQACCAILPTPDLLEPRFTQYWLRSLYYEMREQNHGGAQPNWNGAMIKNIEISIPPLDEQRRIVAYLDSVQARLASLRELQSQTQEELDALLPSVLDRAFKGEL